MKSNETVQPSSTPQPASKAAEVQTEQKPTGTKYEWLEQAGIPEHDWAAAEWLIHKESSWNPKAVNRNGGACGLVQALPCSKLGTNWSDPVHALKWGHKYVHDRYGGWSEAKQFWLQNQRNSGAGWY